MGERERAMKISIIGAGSFGTAMAAVAARCGNDVVLWAHDPNVAEEIEQTRRNPIYLPSIALDRSVRATSSLAEAAEFSDVLFMIVPSHHYRGVLAQIRDASAAARWPSSAARRGSRTTRCSGCPK